MSLPQDFDWQFYSSHYPGLANYNKQQAVHHYLRHGRKMGYDYKPKYYLVMGAIFKNEAHVLAEWLDHYMAEGVEHFYLINNNSNDNYQNILNQSKYVNKVTLFQETRSQVQQNSYNKNFMPVKFNTKWFMINDLDEFVYSRNGYATIVDYLRTLPETVTAIGNFWHSFGSNGHVDQPDNVVDNFVTRSSNYDTMCQRTKSMYVSYYITNFGIHTSDFCRGIRISSDGKSIPNKCANVDWRQRGSVEDKFNLIINHYRVQSYNWFMSVKATRGDAVFLPGIKSRDIKHFRLYDTNHIVDTELKDKRHKNSVNNKNSG